MKFEFGVAYNYYGSGGLSSQIDNRRFSDYDSAIRHSRSLMFEGGFPTISVIADEKYVFDCERHSTENRPCAIYKYEEFDNDDGTVAITTRIRWDKFVEHPEKFLHLAQAIIKNKRRTQNETHFTVH